MEADYYTINFKIEGPNKRLLPRKHELLSQSWFNISRTKLNQHWLNNSCILCKGNNQYVSGGFLTADLALAWPLAGLTTTGINYAVLGLSNNEAFTAI